MSAEAVFDAVGLIQCQFIDTASANGRVSIAMQHLARLADALAPGVSDTQEFIVLTQALALSLALPRSTSFEDPAWAAPVRVRVEQWVQDLQVLKGLLK